MPKHTATGYTMDREQGMRILLVSQPDPASSASNSFSRVRTTLNTGLVGLGV